MTQYWPLEQLRIRTPNLQLSLPTTAQLHELAQLAADGVHAADDMPFTQPWSALPPQERSLSVLQWHWRKLSELGPQGWTLTLVVRRNGTVVGTQDIAGREFGISREVSTGSWLGQRFHGQGIGTEMRAAALELAFRGLGAAAANTSAFDDNIASRRVSEKLGYLPNGSELHVVNERAYKAQRFRLPRERWTSPVDVQLDGVEPCLELLGARQPRVRDHDTEA